MSDEMLADIDQLETTEWLDAAKGVVRRDGGDRLRYLLSNIHQQVGAPSQDAVSLNTPYYNTIDVSLEPAYPGDLHLEGQIESLVRWNAAITVAGSNKKDATLGGHIGTFASICTMYEVGQNHFFKAYNDEQCGDMVFFQGHSSPGIYARSYLEGGITEEQMANFRREVDHKGVSSYPHPWLMPNYWQFATVSMGLGPLLAIYQARLMQYMHNRDFIEKKDRKVWAFCGDGEMDEPESLGAIMRAGRDQLDNLIFVINCNLQRLDGLVNGNGKVIQEYEALFKGAGWNVIKVVWGSDWDALFAADKKGVLAKHLMAACDGDYQTYKTRGGEYIREHFFNQDPDLKALVAHLSDKELLHLTRGGHDPKKIYAAYHSAVNHKGQPTVILMKSVKGYGLGAAGESRNIAHNQKKLTEKELEEFTQKFNIPIEHEAIEKSLRFRPKDDEPAMQYLKAQREKLGGPYPKRVVNKTPLVIPHYTDFAKRLLNGSKDKEMSTTTAYVQILTALCRDKNIGKHIVPITPDESRTFGMEGLFRQLGIFNPKGQQYEPEDRQQVMYYKEAEDGQILQEGINEAGAMASWIAAGTAYSSHKVPLIPCYIYYSMFGFQRVGDMAWQAADMRAKGFLLGATAGRTSLNGEGLQHQDGHSHIQAGLIPNCISYDPCYAYELAVIMWRGLNHMYAEHEDVYYYITMMNDNYIQRAMPEGVEEGILAGIYPLEKPKAKVGAKHVQLVGGGAILKEVEAAADLLQKDFKVTSTLWSLTSANALYRDYQQTQRYNARHLPAKPKKSYLETVFADHQGPIVCSTDYIKQYTEVLRGALGDRLIALGTDGFGRSDTRPQLRHHFEVDRYHVAYHAMYGLYQQGAIDKATLKKAQQKYQITADKSDPLYC